MSKPTQVARWKRFIQYTVNTTQKIEPHPNRIALGFYHATANTVSVADTTDAPASRRNTIPTTTWVFYKWPEDDTKGSWAIITSASSVVEVYESFGSVQEPM